MIVLDTDHLTALKYPESESCSRLTARIQASHNREFATTIVNAEEQLRGWLSEIQRKREVIDQVPAYGRLGKLLEFLREFKIVSFDRDAAAAFVRLRRARIRIGTMDLKIACIALVNDALLLSANRRDFSQVPGLRLESWLPN